MEPRPIIVVISIIEILIGFVILYYGITIYCQPWRIKRGVK